MIPAFFITFLFSCLFFHSVVAQEAFPQGGSSFESAVEIKPGLYQGGQLGWEEEATKQQVYYLNDIKSGQAIEAATKFSGDTNLSVSLYNSDENKLADVYGGQGIDALGWLVGSPTKTGTYYLVLRNDAVEQATNISLDLKVSDKYDANSSSDAGDTIPQALLISLGTYQGYFSGEQGNDEKDYYSLALKKGNKVSVKVTPPSKDSINVAVYDTNRSKLDENTSSGTGEITTLSFTPANDGNYYLEVSCYYGCEKIVNYKMEITGATLPTGGGLIMTTTHPQEPTAGPIQNSSPTPVSQKSNFFALTSRDQKYLMLIIGTVLVVIVVVVFLLRKKPIEKDEPQMNSGSPDADKVTVGYKHPCVYCRKMIPPNSRTCPFCGKSNPQGPIRCPKCNAPVEKDWKVCNHCDLPLSVKCPSCHKTTFFGDYCEHCDKRLIVTCPHCKTEQPPISDICKKCKKSLLVESKT